MNTVSPRDFLDTYFPQRELNADGLLAFSAQMRGELPTYKRISHLSGQERLDAWADTEAQTRTVYKVTPVTCDYDELLAFITADTADLFTAYIFANADDDELTPVDLRTLDAGRLAALRAEAAAAGDDELVDTIDSI